MVVKIGNLRGLFGEKEYPLDDKRLDAIWKRIPQGKPVHAFEVQLSGNFLRH